MCIRDRSQGWLKAPAPALLLPAGEAMLAALEAAAASAGGLEERTFKWKVATEPDPLERQLLEQLLAARLACRRRSLGLDLDRRGRCQGSADHRGFLSHGELELGVLPSPLHPGSFCRRR